MDTTAIRVTVEAVESGYVVGLRVVDEGMTVGESLLPSRSYDADTQEPTGDILWGTSAVAVTADTVSEALAILAPYYGCRLLVVYGVDAMAGEDDGEILIRDARVAAVYAR